MSVCGECERELKIKSLHNNNICSFLARLLAILVPWTIRPALSAPAPPGRWRTVRNTSGR